MTTIIKSFGTILKDNPTVKQIAESFPTLTEDMLSGINVPDSFDGRNVWFDYLTPISFQLDCGRGWIFALVECLSSRYNICTPYQRNVLLTSIQPVYCPDMNLIDKIDKNDKDSSMALANCPLCVNSIYYGLKYLFVNGVCSTSCVIYETIVDPKTIGLKSACQYSTFEEIAPGCDKIFGKERDTCPLSKRALRTFRISGFANIEPKEETIKKEIFKNGPVVCSYLVYDDFINEYDGLTIYKGPKEGAKLLGGHSGKIVGWGQDKDVPYWIISNSWSVNWGQGGYFKMKRGSNVCEVENNVVTLYPDLNLPYKLFPLGVTITDQKLVDLRNSKKIDPDTFYSMETLQKVKQGVLEGRLTPYFDLALVPDMLKVKAGQIDTAPLVFVNQSNGNKINLIYLSLSILSGIILSLGLAFLIRYLIKRNKE